MNIVVGVTGGIAAYKTVFVVRELAEAGHDVHVVPTDAALRFVGRPTWEAISGNRVTTSVHDDVPDVRHVALGRDADVVLIAPATANTIAKLAAGIADDLLGTTVLATTAPVIVAPAMHTEMWEHPATVANVQTLTERGVRLVGPESGRLTGSDSGAGRMSEPQVIVQAVLAAAGHALDLAGLRIALSAGGTREAIDPVRFLGNRSSGKQGVALAEAAAARGASVTLVAANIDEHTLAQLNRHVQLHRVGSAADLEARMLEEASHHDVIIMAAAVADYRPATAHDAKLRKRDSPGAVLTLDLEETTDILAALAAGARTDQTLVGFAAEMPGADETLLGRAAAKIARKGCDLLVANEVGWTLGFERDDNAVIVVDRAGTVVAEANGSKRVVADAVLDAVATARA